MQIVANLHAELQSLKDRFYHLVDPEKAIVEKLHELVGAIVDEMHKFEARIAALEHQNAAAGSSGAATPPSPEPTPATPAATSAAEPAAAPQPKPSITDVLFHRTEQPAPPESGPPNPAAVAPVAPPSDQLVQYGVPIFQGPGSYHFKTPDGKNCYVDASYKDEHTGSTFVWVSASPETTPPVGAQPWSNDEARIASGPEGWVNVQAVPGTQPDILNLVMHDAPR